MPHPGQHDTVAAANAASALQPSADAPADERPSPAARARSLAPLPQVRTSLDRDQILRRLEAAARRGRMPGLAIGQKNPDGGLFTMTDFGHPFEGTLVARVDSESGSERTLSFRTRLRPTGPVVLALVLAASVWPGLPITDSLLKTYFTAYSIPTWWWYLPLSVPFLPWAFLGAVRRSRASILAQALVLVPSIAAEIEGRITPVSADPAAVGSGRPAP
jgi:hypothetical protein